MRPINAYVLPGIEFEKLNARQRKNLKKIFPADALQTILRIVCEYFGITEVLINTQRRDRHIVWPRQVYFYLCSQNTRFSLKKIGESVSKKDHTTVIHSINTVKNMLETDPDLKKQLLHLQNKITEILA